MNRILIISKSRAILGSVSELLTDEGFETITTTDFEGIGEVITGTKGIDLIIAEFGNAEGNDFVSPSELRKMRITQPILYLLNKNHTKEESQYAQYLAAVQCGRPVNIPTLLGNVRRLMGSCYKFSDPAIIDTKSKMDYSPVDMIIGESPQIEHIKAIIKRVASSDVRVMISGENGTGKELVAKCIHELSSRNKQPMVEVNCAAIPEELIESELFGHEKGAFTSAAKLHKGKFESAHKSTLFLDEIGDMCLAAQAKVLRALQEKKICRVGGEIEFPVDTRIIAATNKNLRREIRDKRFREDLFHRLSVVEIVVPTLNDRITDIPILANHFIDELCTSYRVDSLQIEDGAIEMLQNRTWSGNIREFHNALERLVIFADGVITPELVDTYVLRSSY